MRKRNKNKRQQQTNKASTSNKDLNCDTSVAALPGGNGCYYVEEPAASSLPSSSGVPHGVGRSGHKINSILLAFYNQGSMQKSVILPTHN